MNQGGGLQGDVASLAVQVMAGKAMQFVVDNRRELIQCALVAVTPGAEQRAYVATVWRFHSFPRSLPSRHVG